MTRRISPPAIDFLNCALGTSIFLAMDLRIGSKAAPRHSNARVSDNGSPGPSAPPRRGLNRGIKQHLCAGLASYVAVSGVTVCGVSVSRHTDYDDNESPAARLGRVPVRWIKQDALCDLFMNHSRAPGGPAINGQNASLPLQTMICEFLHQFFPGPCDSCVKKFISF